LFHHYRKEKFWNAFHNYFASCSKTMTTFQTRGFIIKFIYIYIYIYKLKINKPSSSKASIESILEGRSTKELAELAAHLLAMATSQEKESPVSSEGSSSNKPLTARPSRPSNWHEDSQDPYKPYDLGEI
jgi:hypothetical protein